MLPLEYRLRPRPIIVVGGTLATVVGLALMWSSPALGVLVGGLFLVLLVWGVLPYFVRAHRLVLAEDGVQLRHGGPWFGASRHVPYADIRNVSGALEAGDTTINLHDVDGREYAIVADLLPSPTDFELVVCTLREQIAKARRHGAHVTSPLESGSDDSAV